MGTAIPTGSQATKGDITRRCQRTKCSNRFKPVRTVARTKTEVPCDWRKYCSPYCSNKDRVENHWRRKIEAERAR